MRRADAAQVCSNLGFVEVDGFLECSFVDAARQIVSERWREGGGAEAPVPSSDVSFRLDQKTGNFKVAFVSRQMQWSVLTEEKKKNQLAQTELRFIKK